jgi:hypothetical protein
MKLSRSKGYRKIIACIERHLTRYLKSQVTRIVSRQHYDGPLPFSDNISALISMRTVHVDTYIYIRHGSSPHSFVHRAGWEFDIPRWAGGVNITAEFSGFKIDSAQGTVK